MRILANPCVVLAVILVLALEAVNRVDAASITYSFDLDSKFQPGFFPQFLPTLGTLLELDFSATGGGGAEFLVSPPVFDGTYNFTVSFMFTGLNPPFSFPAPASSSEDLSFSFPTPTSVLDLAGAFNVSGSTTSGLDFFYGGDRINAQIIPMFTITSPPVDAELLFFGASGQGT
jgi:hypothetical protein